MLKITVKNNNKNSSKIYNAVCQKLKSNLFSTYDMLSVSERMSTAHISAQHQASTGSNLGIDSTFNRPSINWNV